VKKGINNIETLAKYPTPVARLSHDYSPILRELGLSNLVDRRRADAKLNLRLRMQDGSDDALHLILIKSV